MNVEAIKSNLINISNSQIDLIFSIYGLNKDKITSRVLPLLTVLKSLKVEDRNEDYKTDRNKSMASIDAVADLIDTLEAGIEAYKKKYMVRVFPSDLKIMMLYEALNKIDAKQIVKEILLGQDEQPKKKTKQELKEEEKQRIKAEMKLKILQNK